MHPVLVFADCVQVSALPLPPLLKLQPSPASLALHGLLMPCPCTLGAGSFAVPILSGACKSVLSASLHALPFMAHAAPLQGSLITSVLFFLVIFVTYLWDQAKAHWEILQQPVGFGGQEMDQVGFLVCLCLRDGAR